MIKKVQPYGNVIRIPQKILDELGYDSDIALVPDSDTLKEQTFGFLRLCELDDLGKYDVAALRKLSTQRRITIPKSLLDLIDYKGKDLLFVVYDFDDKKQIELWDTERFHESLLTADEIKEIFEGCGE